MCFASYSRSVISRWSNQLRHKVPQATKLKAIVFIIVSAVRLYHALILHPITSATTQTPTPLPIKFPNHPTVSFNMETLTVYCLLKWCFIILTWSPAPVIYHGIKNKFRPRVICVVIFVNCGLQICKRKTSIDATCKLCIR